MKIKKIDTISVVPFIDIMLVLLAIVLTTATFISQGLIKVTLPEAESGQDLANAKQQRVEITIDKNNEIYFNKEQVDSIVLKMRLDTLKREDMIIIRSDKDAKFDRFLLVLDALKVRKLENMAIEVDRSDEAR